MRSLWRTLVSFDNLMIMVLTCIGVATLWYIPRNVGFLSPFAQAFGDLDFTDMVTGRLLRDVRMADTNIVLVNIGHLDRAEIAELLNVIDRHEPAVVGIDAFFRRPKEEAPEGDDALETAMASIDRLVLVSELQFAGEVHPDPWTGGIDAPFDRIALSLDRFSRHAAHGYANFPIDSSSTFRTLREVSFVEPVANSMYERSFPVEIVRLFDTAAARVALERGHPLESVRFTGPLESFYHIDHDQVLDPEVDKSFLRGKIVVLGFLGRVIGDLSMEDAFFTPLNENYVGRSFPDMYGTVIHANVISQILRREYIERMRPSTSWIIAIALLMVNVMAFTWMFTHVDRWYDVFAVTMQLVQSIGIVWLSVILFSGADYKAELKLALLGVVLVGTVHDLYQDSLKKIIRRSR
jgi:CHASE2 domain-containing sensor protein